MYPFYSSSGIQPDTSNDRKEKKHSAFLRGPIVTLSMYVHMQPVWNLGKYYYSKLRKKKKKGVKGLWRELINRSVT